MRLYKSTEDRVILGLCGGISQSFGLDVKKVRIVTALLIVFSFSMLLWVYLIAGLLLPFDEDVSLYQTKRPFSGQGGQRSLTDRQRAKIEQNERDTYYHPPNGKK